MKGSIVVVDGSVRILESIAGQDTDHRCTGRHLVLPLEQAGHGGGACRFAENALIASQKFVGIDDLGVSHIQEGSVAGFSGSDRFLTIDRVADPDGGGDGFRICHGGVVHQGGGTAGLETHHPRQDSAAACLLVFLETHPVSRDVACIAHRNAEPVRSISEGVDDFECSSLLTLQAIGIHRIHESDRVCLGSLPDDVQCPVEVAADGQDLSAVDESLSQFSLGNVPIRDQNEGPHAAATGVGGGGGTCVARAGADHRFTTGFLRFADGHGHATVLEGSGGVQAVVFHEHLHTVPDSFGDAWDRDQRCGAFTKSDHRCCARHRKPGTVRLNETWPVLHHRIGGETPTEVLQQRHQLEAGRAGI